MTPFRRRVWSEMVPLAQLASSPVLAELARRRIELLAAVEPPHLEEALALVERAHELGLSIGLWPLLDEGSGRWLHPGNAEAFVAFIDVMLEALDRRGLRLDALALDLEPPIAEVRRLSEGHIGAARAWLTRGVDVAPLRRITAELEHRGIEVIAAIVPPVLLEGRASRGWQRALGCPIDAVPCDVVSAMLYTSLFEGYSAGALGRADGLALLDRFARLARARFGERASVSLGAVGAGALGDERTYRDPGELAADVACVRAAGVDDLALFDLAGVLARPPVERWLDIFVETAPAASAAPPTLRARALIGALWITGLALDRAAAT